MLPTKIQTYLPLKGKSELVQKVETERLATATVDKEEDKYSIADDGERVLKSTYGRGNNWSDSENDEDDFEEVEVDDEDDDVGLLYTAIPSLTRLMTKTLMSPSKNATMSTPKQVSSKQALPSPLATQLPTPPLPNRNNANNEAKLAKRMLRKLSSYTPRLTEFITSPDLVQDKLSNSIIQLSVSTAVMIKQSPLPDFFCYTMDRGIQTYQSLDMKYDLQSKVTVVVGWITAMTVWWVFVLLTAMLKSVVAYQQTPGYGKNGGGREQKAPLPNNHRKRRQSDADANVVNLNVGGTLYTTTLATLVQLQREPLSVFNSWFGPDSLSSEIKSSTPIDKNGTYFIDRDGLLFRYILNYLRGKDIISEFRTQLTKFENSNNDVQYYRQMVTELVREAEYFKLQRLQHQLEELSKEVMAIASATKSFPKLSTTSKRDALEPSDSEATLLLSNSEPSSPTLSAAADLLRNKTTTTKLEMMKFLVMSPVLVPYKTSKFAAHTAWGVVSAVSGRVVSRRR